jgi:hypothetical protein
MGNAAGGNMASSMMSPRAMRDVLMREVSRMDAIRATIGEPTSPESAVAQRAYSRLRTIVTDLDVPADAVPGIIDMARQVADILLMMKGEDEPACDFQVRMPWLPWQPSRPELQADRQLVATYQPLCYRP